MAAPTSPKRNPPPSGYFFSAPASPMHYLSSEDQTLPFLTLQSSASFEFEFFSRFSPKTSTKNVSMTSADQLFLNGKIRPMKVSSLLHKPQNLAPLIDQDGEEEIKRWRGTRARNKSHRKARSMSPLRNGQKYKCVKEEEFLEMEIKNMNIINESTETTSSGSASSSRSSSSGRNSKKWIFLKDLLHRSKSEGRANGKERFWSTSAILTPSSSKDDKKSTGKAANGRVAKSARELHYEANRAQAEEMKRKTFLPYRQGLLGCLAFSSKGYTALNGFTKSLNPISSG